MTLGFTGSRFGMSAAQQQRVNAAIAHLKPNEVHHGSCVGADANFHVLAYAFDSDIRFVVHPPTETGLVQVIALGNVTTMAPEPYLVRNRRIVDACDVLLGAPAEEQEQVRGGTWSTVRYARAQGKTVYVVLPSGKVTK